ncbi:acyl-CoA reductase [Paenibacillus septentrionalis]|uniref:Acyl-CoA reductase n=1 Tax=Paenibacillus septentrionalis TaxID=429342 RepID=A0ABW1VB72_9BACL
MKFYLPAQNGETVLKHLSEVPTLTPFHETVLSFIQALSKRFVQLRQYPEAVALGFWMRKANIAALQQQWEQVTGQCVIKARGTVFHIAPSNVDTIFVYSWILSLLAGNRNMIRVSSKQQAQQNILLQAIVDELSNPHFQELAERNVVFTYEHHDQTTAELSMLSHVRVVWGGDETVDAIRRVPLAPMASELVFPDRFSMSLIHAQAMDMLNDQALQQLAEQFYNDAYWFDQLACSSPRLVVWEGKADQIERAQMRFWQMLEQVIRSKTIELAPAVQVQKLTTSMLLASQNDTIKASHGMWYSRVLVDQLGDDIRERHCGGGFFVEKLIRDLSELSRIIVDKDQTLTYFGYSKDQLLQLINQIGSRGIDRVVPIGKALDFQETWDGQSFLRSFTREIVII